MWKPPQRIRHQTSGATWPDAAAASASRLFSPINVGRLSLEERTWVPAMVPWRATEAGEVTDDVVDWYRRFAEGKPGAIVVEATGVRDVPSGPLLRIGHDRFIPGLSRIVEAVREASGGRTKLFVQLIDFLTIRRRPDRTKYFARFLTVTPALRAAVGASDDNDARTRFAAMNDEALAGVLPARDYENLTRGFRERVTDVDAAHIRDLPKVLPAIIAQAARRAEQAGFDGAELHYAHAYTMASFLSRRNDRPDGYGGGRENRVRLPLDVFRAARAIVSDKFVIGCRMLSDDCIDGGSDVEDAAYFAAEFARAGMDFISLSRGGKFEDALEPKVGEAIYPYTGPSGYECMPQIISDEFGPFGRNFGPAAEIRTAVRAIGAATPIIAAGGIHHFDQAEEILTAGNADIVGLARQALADPDWFEKVRLGRGAEVNVCKYSNYCEGLDQKHKMVTCQLWDRAALDEPGVKLAPDGKRRTLAPHWRRGDP